MKRIAIAALAATAAFVAAPANATAVNLLQNGSFENGNVPQGFSGLSNWKLTGTGTNPTNDAHWGNYAADGIARPNTTTLSPDAAGDRYVKFVSDNANQALSQTVTLQAGTYLAGFDYMTPALGSNNPNFGNLSASLLSTGFASGISASALAVNTWYNAAGQTVFNVGQTGSYSFSFTSGAFSAKDIIIDRAYLIAAPAVAAVPEPATWAMMLVGFGMVGATARYRRRNVSAVIA